MSAEYGHRFQQKRTPIQDVVPLDTPMILMFDPSSACNQNCPFCPNGTHNKKMWSERKQPGFMSYELYRKVIDEAAAFPGRINVVRLYKEGEPLLNKRLPDMIRYAKIKDIADRVDLTTNGTLLEPDLNLALIDAGLDRINISFYGTNSADWEKNSGGNKIDYDNLINNIAHLYQNKKQLHIFIKIMEDCLCGRSFEEFSKSISGICDEVSLEHCTNGFPYYHSTDNPQNNYGIEGDPHEACVSIFYTMVINSDGTYDACDVDWNRDVILGDAKTQNIVDVWNSEEMFQLRKAHLTLQKEPYYACKHCGELIYAQIDNIDPYREEILQKLMSSRQKV